VREAPMAQSTPLFRRTMEPHLRRLARQYPVVFLTGPRQSGKTTLSRVAFPRFAYSSLEDLDEREFARTDPRGFLARFEASGASFSTRCSASPGCSPTFRESRTGREHRGWSSPDHSSSSCHAASGRLSPGGRRCSPCCPVGLRADRPPPRRPDPPGQGSPRPGVPALDLSRILFSGMYPRIHAHGLAPGSGSAVTSRPTRTRRP